MTARVLRLDPAAHRAAQALLPWYAAGALEASERARVEAHLAVCGVCRRELGFERRLRSAQCELGPGQAWERSLARVRQRLADEASDAGAADDRSGSPGVRGTTGPTQAGSEAPAIPAATEARRATSATPAISAPATSMAPSGAASATSSRAASAASAGTVDPADPADPAASTATVGSTASAASADPAASTSTARPAPAMRPRAPRATRGAEAGGHAPRPASDPGPRPARRWWVAAQAAALLALVPMLLDAPGPSPEPYRALGRPPGIAAARVLVRFRPEATELQMRQALRASGARLLDGPTASDAYLLAVSPGREAEAVERLRAEAAVELAVSLAPAGGGRGP